MTALSLLPPKIPHGIRTESAWKECGSRARRARMRAPAIPYRTRTGTRARLRVRSYRPSFYNQLEPRADARIVQIVNHTHEHQGRLIARIVRTLLASEHFDSLADLTDALKFRLARLHIRWTNDDINSAFAMIASNTPLLPVLPAHVRSQNEKRGPDHVLSHAEAAAILNRLGIEL